MFLLKNIGNSIAIVLGILLFLILIPRKKVSKKNFVLIIISIISVVLIVLIKPFTINSIESERRVIKRAKSIERGIERSLREDDYILLEKQLNKKILALLIEETSETQKKWDIEKSKGIEESREEALARITEAIKTYKKHHAKEKEKEKKLNSDILIKQNLEFQELK